MKMFLEASWDDKVGNLFLSYRMQGFRSLFRVPVGKKKHSSSFTREIMYASHFWRPQNSPLTISYKQTTNLTSFFANVCWSVSFSWFAARTSWPRTWLWLWMANLCPLIVEMNPWSSSIYEVIRPVLNFLFFSTIRFHKYKKA